jgi:hypothetical protein
MKRGYQTISPRGLERNWGERAMVLRNRVAYKGRIEISAGGEVYLQSGRRKIFLEHGENIRIHTPRSLTEYVFLDESD